tara:strand:- start:11844 stop:13106 length:1263 start_codon:yes stop_codon:yes gene_type:complete
MANAFQYSDAEIDDLKNLIGMVNRGEVQPDSFVPEVYADMQRVSGTFNVPLTPPAFLSEGSGVPVDRGVVPMFDGMTNEELENMQAQVAMAEASNPAPVIEMPTPVVTPVAAPQQQARVTTRRRDSAASAGKTLPDFASELDAQIAQAERDLVSADRELLEYDASSEQFPGESKDLGLMRALSNQLREEGGRDYSNIAAQLAMVQDANFAPVFDRAVNRRVNAARKFFGRAGTIQRAAQGERAAFRQSRARSRKRSEERLKAIRQKLDRLREAKFKIQRDVFSGNTAAAKERRAAMAGSRAADKPGRPIDSLLSKTTADIRNLEASRAQLTDPKAAIKDEVFSQLAKELGRDTGFRNKQEAIAAIDTQLLGLKRDRKVYQDMIRGGVFYTPRTVASPNQMRRTTSNNAAPEGDAAGRLYK